MLVYIISYYIPNHPFQGYPQFQELPYIWGWYLRLSRCRSIRRKVHRSYEPTKGYNSWDVTILHYTYMQYVYDRTHIRTITYMCICVYDRTHTYIYIYIRPSSHDNGLNPSDFIPGVEHTICYVGQNPNVFSCVFHVLC